MKRRITDTNAMQLIQVQNVKWFYMPHIKINNISTFAMYMLYKTTIFQLNESALIHGSN